MPAAKQAQPESLCNSEIAELLATEADGAKQPLQKALRRASRRAFLWPEEAAQIVHEGRSLEELPAVGPFLSKLIERWLKRPPSVPERPAIRTGFLSIPEARAILAKTPSWAKRNRGDLQMHTSWSDGTGSIEEMSEAAAERGYEYIAITDHSKGLKIAGGINETQLLQQAAEIELVNKKFAGEERPLRVLRSIELNLDPQGGGDMEEDALGRLDIVLGCFHSALRRKEDQTERYLAALRNPSIQILGHPRGRIYNFRLGLSADWPRVFETAAALDKAVEIDSYPDRQDLNIDLLKLAKKSGCRISLGTDSHGPSQLGFIELGLAAALSSGIKPERILNFMPVDQLLEWVESVRGRAGDG
ncbi:MAG: PHP domain-containing protein [Acidobacteriales bacterium]|nr:PHP domain-containing protein [Terriglobales bacterium]